MLKRIVLFGVLVGLVSPMNGQRGPAGTVQPEWFARELNTEPVVTLRLIEQAVEIGSNGIRTTRGQFGSGDLTVGSVTRGTLALGSQQVAVVGELLSLSARRAEVRYEIRETGPRGELTAIGGLEEEPEGRLLLQQTLEFSRGDEALIEVAESLSGETRYAVRIVPEFKVRAAVLPYPRVVSEFGIHYPGILLRDHQVLARSTARSSNTELDEEVVQLLQIHSDQGGSLALSYRPFPGSEFLGYVQDNTLFFTWEGHVYEWISPGETILPGGPWALYVGVSKAPFRTPQEYVGVGATQRRLD